MTIQITQSDPADLERTWWRGGVLYQIYPRSFADSNGDGVGDLRGIIDRLDHLQWLGIDGIWLNPTMPSPNADWGYDVADYRGVHPELGTPEDLEELIADAGRRGIRILLDLVPNHTSDQHLWFQDALTSRAARYRDYYVWADPRPDGSPPNNWISHFGGPAWEWHEPTGQYYLHQFLAEQPDLNWWNEDVRAEFDDILRYWYERGVAGFRIDVAHAIVKDAELRDDLPVGPDDHPQVRALGFNPVHSMNRPEAHDVLRRFRRRSAAQQPERILVGETYVFDVEQLVPFYGDGSDELHMAFNLVFHHSRFEADVLRPVVEAVEQRLPAGAWPVYTGSSHDGGRFATHWGGDDPRKARCALMMLLALRGTPFLYYGDEIGMPEVPIAPEDALDPVARLTGNPDRNREPGRTPMHWERAAGGGFTAAGVKPWLPLGDVGACNVEDQRRDPASTLHLARDLIALRRACDDLAVGAYSTLPAPDGVWAWRRGAATAVALNLSDAPVAVSLEGKIALGTSRARDGHAFDGRLAPWEGVIVQTP